MAALYSASLVKFLDVHPTTLIGDLTINLKDEGFDTTKLTVFSWQEEIKVLQQALCKLSNVLPEAFSWQILLEYVLPIVGQRIDCVLLANDIIYVIEYKGGSSSTARNALQQAQEYALNLADFHEESRGRIIIPIALGDFKSVIKYNEDEVPQQGAAILPEDVAEMIVESFRKWANKGNMIIPRKWNQSRYFPVPTIIEAASNVYLNHDVKAIARSRSGTENLEETQRAIEEAVSDARRNGVKKLILVTGVPGAGKTLAGLNAVQYIQTKLDLAQEQASFLSGNRPLVEVLREALRRSVVRRKKGIARAIQSRIREMHRFVRDSYDDDRPPADRLIVFDEAQRAWTAAHNKKKFGRDCSEPSMVLQIMGRHSGWAVVVALVGGGQEIHSGEAGLAAWGDALSNSSDTWEVVTSPEAIHGGTSVAGSRLFRTEPPKPVTIKENKFLHLSISKRSFETEVTAAWVNSILNGQQEEAASLSKYGLPIYLTRDLDAARRWLRSKAKGRRRAGLIASSGAGRLRAEGVEAPTFNFLGGIDYTKWFLEPEGDYRSSNQLEVAMSEFEMQGLEIDLAGLLWGGDLIFTDNQVVTRVLKGLRWNVVHGNGETQSSADDSKTRILNKYRVLLTRFRKSMVIFVPQGSVDDSTRDPNDFNSVYKYLLACGAKPLANN